jgi:S-DNA-T family DNA segregation ATPase FtsK/SpoIIIE
MDASADRLKAQGLRKLEAPTRDHPLNVVIVDELGRLSDDKEVQGPLKTLINVGRGPGVSVIGALQTPTKEVAKFRDEIPVKWVGRMESKEYVRLCLGREAVLNGAAADEIPASMPGAGYMKIDRLDDDDELTWLDRVLPWRRRRREILAGRSMEPVRMRCYHVTDELIAEVNAMFAPEDEAAIAELDPSVDDEPTAAPAPAPAPAVVAGVAPAGGERDWEEGRVVRDGRGRFAGGPRRGLYDDDDPEPDEPESDG